MCWLAATAKLISERTCRCDAQASRKAWAKWSSEGPAQGLAKHHRMTRIDVGWIPSRLAKVSDQEPDDEADLASEDDEVPCFVRPMSAQQEVDADAVAWGLQWGFGMPCQQLP